MNVRRLRLAAGLLAATVACGDSGGPPAPPPPPPPPPAGTLTLNAGNNQVGPAGQALATALSVLARNASNNPAAGVTVNWAVASGGGSVAPASSITDAAGLASATRTLGPNAGTQTATATVTGIAPVTFTAIGRVQGAVTFGSKFLRQLLDTVLAVTPDFPVIAQALDENNVPVQGVIVNWAASGGGAVSQAVDTTDAGGESQVNYTYGATAGAYGARATVTGLVGSPADFVLTAGAGNPAVLAKSAGDNLTANPGGQVGHTVVTRDSYGNPRNGVTINWSLGTGGGSLSTMQNITGGNGTASVTRTLGGSPGSQTVTAAASTALTPASVTFTTTAALTVNVANNSFTPAAVTVAQNGTVVWQWIGPTLPHNITWAAAAGAPANEPDRTNGSISRQFLATGTFTYQCTNHVGMNGQVTVTP